ncbi:MAG TPA: saccharopine dehydrogenase NADP-binding domain-containing protein [Arenimonas sp.]|uniref:saccharopine dehydrogenase family protein n=1 Tax=Arenimonas sp. TaxID=1872635 RepID=UPI002D80E954|nr:saccharopine dehydrogenase NADP-binding domain-containing protein [Arenimonas sp.]HEU0153929.1 saccharopine dehydrogenase NADP-binding domain-containing protein [Arenimonas sp.]
MDWMIYGANGYTGRMMVEEAVKRGLRPVLAGRSAAALEPLAQAHGLPVRAFALDNPQALRTGLNGIGLVMHCAGPFSATCAPMLDACLDVGAHYLDITGEIDVFAHCHAQHDRARDKGVVVLPGSGFDVVPTDCLAAQLKRELPTADSLVLAFEAGGGPSPGTAKTSVEGLGKGGRARIDGKLTRVPLAWKTRTFERDGEARFAMTIPWGDVYTAFVSTGIGNVEVYMGVPPDTAGKLRRLRLLGPLLGLGPVQSLLKKQVAKRVRGPSDATRGKTGCVVWGEARDAAGHEVKRRLRTPNGYEITVTAALGIVARLLGGPAPAGGYYTPSALMGADYVLSLPGVSLD